MNIKFLVVWYKITTLLLLSGIVMFLHIFPFEGNWLYTIISEAVLVLILVIIDIKIVKIHK